MSKSKTFRHVVLCHTDDFPSNKKDKIKGWVESHGGIFSKRLTPDVTHFVASKLAWKKYPPIGKLTALLFQDKMVKVYKPHKTAGSATYASQFEKLAVRRTRKSSVLTGWKTHFSLPPADPRTPNSTSGIAFRQRRKSRKINRL
jgi:hypothetical protein